VYKPPTSREHCSGRSGAPVIEPELIREAARWALEGLRDQIPQRYRAALAAATRRVDELENANLERLRGRRG
jgi:hypothetical protein